MEDLELISSKLCPFVQRSIIVLNYKNINHKVTFIDLEDLPEWFIKISPLKKVPVLKIDDKDVLFESAVISEYIDDITPGSMKPKDSLQLAKNRAWIEFCTQCIIDQFILLQKTNEEEYVAQLNQLHTNLGMIEDEIKSQPFFNGDRLNLVDTAYAPLFMRYEVLNSIAPVFSYSDFPKLSAWSAALLQLDAVKNSVVEDFALLFKSKIKTFDGYIASILI